MSSMDHAGERIAKRRRPPKRPMWPPFFPRIFAAYILLTGILSYISANATGRYGLAFVQGAAFVVNAWQGWVWVQWTQWSRYYKTPIPRLEGPWRISGWLIIVYVVGYDLVGLLFMRKLPWESW